MRTVVSVLVVVLVEVLGFGQLAKADDDPPVNLEDNRVVLRARDPGSAGRSGRKPKVSSGPTECLAHGTLAVPCTSQWGHWDHTHNCYVVTRDATGGWCLDLPVFSLMPGSEPRRIPPTQAGVELPDPGQLARIAVEHMNLQPVTIATSPKTLEQDPHALTYVKWHTWLWNANPDPASTGPITQTATAGSYTVTATATIDHITWDMGDGETVTCTTTTPWQPRYNRNQPSPDCDHVYTRDGEYVITATTHWTITWNAPGARGTLTAETSDTAHITVAEAHMLNTPTKRR